MRAQEKVLIRDSFWTADRLSPSTLGARWAPQMWLPEDVHHHRSTIKPIRVDLHECLGRGELRRVTLGWGIGKVVDSEGGGRPAGAST